jgi:hypothetical protein
VCHIGDHIFVVNMQRSLGPHLPLIEHGTDHNTFPNPSCYSGISTLN